MEPVRLDRYQQSVPIYELGVAVACRSPKPCGAGSTPAARAKTKAAETLIGPAAFCVSGPQKCGYRWAPGAYILVSMIDPHPWFPRLSLGFAGACFMILLHLLGMLVEHG